MAYFSETVINEKKADHFFHWTQHVTLGPPFLGHDSSRISMPGTRGRALAGGYGDNDLLAAGDFRWPIARARAGGEVDLSRPFAQQGLGILATVLLNRKRPMQYIAALNEPNRLLFGYCFRHSDFPWVTLWEENHARPLPPWNGRSQTRGLEFRSTPFPVTRRRRLRWPQCLIRRPFPSYRPRERRLLATSVF